MITFLPFLWLLLNESTFNVNMKGRFDMFNFMYGNFLFTIVTFLSLQEPLNLSETSAFIRYSLMMYFISFCQDNLKLIDNFKILACQNIVQNSISIEPAIMMQRTIGNEIGWLISKPD